MKEGSKGNEERGRRGTLTFFFCHLFARSLYGQSKVHTLSHGTCTKTSKTNESRAASHHSPTPHDATRCSAALLPLVLLLMMRLQTLPVHSVHSATISPLSRAPPALPCPALPFSSAVEEVGRHEQLQRALGLQGEVRHLLRRVRVPHLE